MAANPLYAEIDRLRAENKTAWAIAGRLAEEALCRMKDNAVLLAGNRDLLERIIKEGL